MVIRYLIEILLLAVQERQREGMRITSGNGNKTRLNLGSGMVMGISHLGMGRNGIEKDMSAHLYY